MHPRNPARSLGEFIAAAKDKSFTFASAGTGTGPHIGAEYFFREIASVKAVHVPFSGGAPAVTAAVGNHVDAVWIVLPTVTPHEFPGFSKAWVVVPPASRVECRSHGAASFKC